MVTPRAHLVARLLTRMFDRLAFAWSRVARPRGLAVVDSATAAAGPQVPSIMLNHLHRSGFYLTLLWWTWPGRAGRGLQRCAIRR